MAEQVYAIIGFADQRIYCSPAGGFEIVVSNIRFFRMIRSAPWRRSRR